MLRAAVSDPAQEFKAGVLTVQPDEHVGGAEDVDVGGHEPLERPSKG
jgi:hypothetical protein